MRPDLLERNNSSQEQHGADVHHPEGKHQEHEGPAAPQTVRPVVNTHPQMAQRPAPRSVTEQQGNGHATASQTPILQGRELIDAPDGEDRGSRHRSGQR